MSNNLAERVLLRSFKSRYVAGCSHLTLLLAVAALAGRVTLTPASAQNLPTGGSVAAGSVVINQPSANQLNITQSSQSAVVNWLGFSIGAGSSVNFTQPNASSAILNRVTGNAPSTIAGSLTANGQVYLVNPNGIAITGSGVVNTAGFVASTLGIGDGDFMSGKRTFTGNGASAAVSNAGAINVGRGGYAALIGGTVSNSGSINVPLGKIGLGSGERATLDFSGDGFLQVAVPTSSRDSGALITNSGTIKADGGSVNISAATAREAARNAVNISGLVQARSISGRAGAIVIGGGEGGRVDISGQLNTASRRRTGGNITVTGRDINLKGATLTASGRTGGGTVRIGGDAQGRGSLQQAQSLTMDSNTRINADATGSGNGGNVTLWSTGTTSVAGLITSKGGADGGNGGTIETSGHTIDFAGLRVDASAPFGTTGTWLVDPVDLTVDAGAAATISSNLASSNVSLQTTATTASGTGVQASGPGDIYVTAPITWSSANTLTLSAYNSINIISSIAASGNGKVVLTTNNNIGGSNSAGDLNFYGGGNIQLLGASAGLTINGNAYTLVQSMAQLEAIASNLTGRYALAKPLDLSGKTYTDSVIPFVANVGFTGDFNGLGNTISNMTIVSTTSPSVGLFAQIGGNGSFNSGGRVENLGMIGGSVSSTSGSAFVGSVAAANMGTITNVYATTSVSGSGTGATVGGLVGYNWGTISKSRASGAVSVPTSSVQTWAGGLVGLNEGYSAGSEIGVIKDSFATGTVSGGGGTGGVTYGGGAGSSSGGLVGENRGSIVTSYSTGTVTGGAGTYIGGLIGENSVDSGAAASVTNSYWDSNTSGIGGVNHGGGSPLTTATLQNGSLPTGFSSSIWNAASGRYPLLGPRILTINLTAQSTTYGTPYTLNQSAYTETENGVTLTGGNIVSLPGLTITVAGTGTSSGTTTMTNAGNYLLSAAGASASGFIISYGTAPSYLTVNPRVVTLTGTRSYNGSTSIAAGILSASNVVGADNIGLTGTGSVASANASGSPQTLNLSGLSLSNSNYTLTGGTGTVTITPLVVSLTGSRSYNGSTSIAAGILGASNVVGADNIGLTGTGSVASANASGTPQTLNLAGLSLSNSNYTLTGASGSVTINPLPVTLTGTQVYNGSTAVTATLSASNLIGGDTLTISGTPTGTLASANAGAQAMTSLVGLSLGNSNYTLTGGTGTVTVTPLVVSLTGARSYNGSTSIAAGILSASNVVGADNIGLTGSGSVVSANASGTPQTLNLSGLSLSNSNYTLTGASGSVIINPLPVALTGTQVYNGSTAVTATLSASNLIGGDTLTISGTPTGTLTSANAGAQAMSSLAGLSLSNSNYTVTGGTGTVTVTPLVVTLTGSRSYNGSTSIAAGILSASNVIGADNIGLTGTGSVASANASGTPQTLNLAGLSLSNGNYTLTGASGSVTINPLPVMLTGTQVYNGSTAVTATLSASNLIGGDTLTISGTPTGTLASANAGAQAMTSLAGLSLSNSNYTLTGGTGTVTVTPLVVTLTGSRSYNGSTSIAAGILTASNVVGADNIGLTGSGSVASANASATPQTLNLSGLSLSNSNYTLTGASGSVTINPLSVMLTGTQVYNGLTAVTASLSASNLIGGDTLTISGAPTGTLASANAGAQAMTSLSGLSLSNSNYTLTGGIGIVTVTPAPITVTALGGTSTYGASSANPGLSASGLQNGETVGVLTGLSNSFGITGASGVLGSPYTLSVIGTLTNGNYFVTARNTGTWTVTPAPVTVTAVSGSSVFGSSPANPGLSATGLQNGESVAVLTGLSNSFGITSTSSPGNSPYTLLVTGTMTNPNYTVAGRIDGIWTVTMPSGAPEQFASVGANNNFYPTLLPDNAKPLQSSELEIPKDGMRVLSSDSRFNSAFVCFSSGSGTAPSCFSEAR
jgi:filamentous hemagglutinin family protein